MIHPPTLVIRRFSSGSPSGAKKPGFIRNFDPEEFWEASYFQKVERFNPYHLPYPAVRLQWLVDRQADYNHIMAVLGASASLSCAMTHPAEKISFFRRVSGSPPRVIVPNTEKYQLINNQELVIRRVRGFLSKIEFLN